MLTKLLSLGGPRGLRGLIALALGFAITFALTGDVSARIFTLDNNNNGTLELDGSDDLLFSFCGTSGINPQAGCNDPGEGVIDGAIKAVDIFIDASEISTTFGTVDWATQDVLVFEVELFSPSGSMDAIGVSIPALVAIQGLAASSPDGLGTLTGAGVAPTGFGLPAFTGRGDFIFGTNVLAGQTTVRLFATWDTSPVLNDTMAANFMVSSGLDADFPTDIAPEPSSALLLLLGGTALAVARRRRS